MADNDGTIHLERYTPDARAIVAGAQQLADDRQHAQVTPLHLLARLIEQEQELKAQSSSVMEEKDLLSVKLTEKTAARDQLRETLSSLRNDEAETEQEFKTARQARDQAMKTLASYSSRLKSLEDLEKFV